MLVALVASRCGMRGGAVPWGAMRAQEELGENPNRGAQSSAAAGPGLQGWDRSTG